MWLWAMKKQTQFKANFKILAGLTIIYRTAILDFLKVVG